MTSHISGTPENHGAGTGALRLRGALCSCKVLHEGWRIWNLTEKSGIPEAKETAIEEACNCPSGRLVMRDRRSGEIIEPELERSIVVIEYPAKGEHGPLWVRGGIPVMSSDGRRLPLSGTGSPSAVAGNPATNRSATGVMCSTERLLRVCKSQRAALASFPARKDISQAS